MIKVITVGKLKEKYLKEASEEYSKRLSRYTKLSMIEIEDESNLDVSSILKKEGKNISKYVSDKDFVITLEIEGNTLSSNEFAEKMDNVFLNYSNIVFIIGGSYGLSDEIKKRANYKLSFSNMTFPHQLFRVMLLEQIYRTFKINNNEEYHK